MGNHRIFANNKNLITDGTVSASQVKSSNSVAMVDSKRAGSGVAMVVGDYSGTEDKVYWLKIVDSVAGSPNRATAPVKQAVGVGNLEIEDIGTLEPQTFTIALEHRGTVTKAARYRLAENTSIRANLENFDGSDGNGIRLSVTDNREEGLPLGRIPEEISAGTSELDDPFYAISTKEDGGETGLLDDDGNINDAAPRVKFKHDPQVYRLYETFADHKTVYNFTPAIPRKISKNTEMFLVTGSQVVTIEGIIDSAPVVEEYTGVVTIYNLLEKIANPTPSRLVEAIDSTSANKKPGGIACDDLPERMITEVHHFQPQRSGTETIEANPLIDLVVKEDPNDPNLHNGGTIEIKCTNTHTIPGAETWSVKSAGSGEVYGTATTGITYSDSRISFTIKAVLSDIPATEVGDGITWTPGFSHASREEGEYSSGMCISPFIPGSNFAASGLTSITAVYHVPASNAPDCTDCSQASILGFISPECIGNNGTGIDIDHADYADAIESVITYASNFTRKNTFFLDELDSLPAVPKIDDEGLYILLFSIERYDNHDFEGEFDTASYQIIKKLFKTKEAAQAYYDAGTNPFNNDHKFFQEAYTPSFASVGGTGSASPVMRNATSMIPCMVVGWEGEPIDGIDEPGYITRRLNSEPSKIPVMPTSTANSSVGGANKDMALFKSLAGIAVSVLTQVYDNDAGLDMWRSMWTAMEEDLDKLFLNTMESFKREDISEYNAVFLEKYNLYADRVLLAAGILPSDGSTSSGCWDPNILTQPHWKINGSDYLPALTNTPYHSTRYNENDEPESTNDFGIIIKVKCPQYLKEGDTVSLSINTDNAPTVDPTYNIGDTYTIPIKKGNVVELRGGETGTDEHTWAVISSKPENGLTWDRYVYSFAEGADNTYECNGLIFNMTGDIRFPYQDGDKYTFAIESGSFIWSEDGGQPIDAASAAEINPESPTEIGSDGMKVLFTDGPSPSFEIGDTYEFKVYQPYSPNHTQYPSDSFWEWVSSDVQLDCDYGSVKTMDSVVVANHNIPSTATVKFQGSSVSDFSSIDWEETLQWNDQVMLKLFALPHDARYVRLDITGAPDGVLGWWWAGEYLSTTYTPVFALRREYALANSSFMMSKGSIFMGYGWAGSMEWEYAIVEPDFTNLLSFMDHVKMNNDEPFVLLAHKNYESEGRFVRMDADSVEIADLSNYQADTVDKRYMSITVPLVPVFK